MTCPACSCGFDQHTDERGAFHWFAVHSEPHKYHCPVPCEIVLAALKGFRSQAAVAENAARVAVSRAEAAEADRDASVAMARSQAAIYAAELKELSTVRGAWRNLGLALGAAMRRWEGK